MSRIVIVPGNAGWSEAARDALAAGGFDVVAASTPAEAAQAAREQTLAVAVDGGFAPLEELAALLRGAERTENLPILVVVRDPLRDDLDRHFRLGIDDYLVASAAHQVRDRAVALSKGDPWSGLRAPSGRLLLAGEDRARRILIARIIRRWGFDLSFASNRDELLEQLRQGTPPRAVIADGLLPPDDESATLAAARRDPKGRDVPWLFVADVERRDAARAAMLTHGRATVYSRGGPPENIIFALNDLLQPGAVEARRSPRLLHAAPVAFWADGAPDTIWAYSYNLNRTGLYVRTLVPPPMGTLLHLRFRPPHGDGLVGLDAQVMWRKELGAAQGPMYPPGVGVQFVRMAPADEAALHAGYQQLLQEGERSGTVRASTRPSGEEQRSTLRVTIDPTQIKEKT
ncbi:MAG: PilZ domain-containing protein [Deltaproteobacteria bacterium]|nr:PilZ domain-containing protein [Deltaproteobacteria bacterium]